MIKIYRIRAIYQNGMFWSNKCGWVSEGYDMFEAKGLDEPTQILPTGSTWDFIGYWN